MHAHVLGVRDPNPRLSKRKNNELALIRLAEGLSRVEISVPQ
jgi:hypothetical protein